MLSRRNATQSQLTPYQKLRLLKDQLEDHLRFLSRMRDDAELHDEDTDGFDAEMDEIEEVKRLIDEELER